MVLERVNRELPHDSPNTHLRYILKEIKNLYKYKKL